MTVKPVEYKRYKYFIDPLYIVALIAPFHFLIRYSPGSFHYSFDIVGVLWAYTQSSYSGSIHSNFFFFDTLWVAIAFLLSIFRFVFVIAIRKHQKGLIRQRTVWISAVLSQIPTSIFLFSPFFGGYFGGPIPILLVIGLIFDRKVGSEPPIVPWEDESLEPKNG